MRKTGALTGFTDESADAARRWTKNIAELTNTFHRFGNVVLENMHYVGGAFNAVGAVIQTTTEGIGAAIVGIVKEIVSLGKAFYDVSTFNFTALQDDLHNVMHSAVDEAKGAAKDITAAWDSVDKMFRKPAPLPELRPGVDRGDMDLGGGEGKQKGGRGGVLDADMQALDALKLDHEVTLEEEINFWQKRLAAVRKGSDEYKAIVAKLAPLMQRELKKPQDSGDQRSVDLSGITIPEDELARAVKANSDAVKQTVDADRFGAEEKMRIAAEEYRDVEQNSAFEVQMGRMTAEQRLQILRQAAVEENRIRQQQSQFVQMLDMNDARRYMQDLKQQEQMARESARRMTQLNQQAALDFKNKWNQAMQSFNQGFRRVIGETLTGTKSIGQAFAQMFSGIVIDLADMVAQWLLKEAEKWAMLHVMQALGIGQQKATQAAANVATVTGDAAVAAAGALAYYSAINPPAAPALAAAQFAITMAYAPMAAFAEGGVVNGQRGMGVPILAHAGERVLTPGQTENFHKLVNQTTNAPSSSQKLEMHLQQNIHAYDRSGMRNTLRAHADDLMDIVQDGIRSGKLKYA
jgi:hypothetical protein